MAARRPVAGFRVPAPLVPVVADAVAGALSLPVANPLWRPPPEVAVADPEIVAEDIVVAAWPVELDVAAVELYLYKVSEAGRKNQIFRYLRLGSIAPLDLLLLHAERIWIVGAVVVASQNVLDLCAFTSPVIWPTVVEKGCRALKAAFDYSDIHVSTSS